MHIVIAPIAGKGTETDEFRPDWADLKPFTSRGLVAELNAEGYLGFAIDCPVDVLDAWAAKRGDVKIVFRDDGVKVAEFTAEQRAVAQAIDAKAVETLPPKTSKVDLIAAQAAVEAAP